jgi:hypothetical protein
VRLAGGVGEGRGHAHQVAGRLPRRDGQGAVQLGEAQVVAHAQAHAVALGREAPPAARRPPARGPRRSDSRPLSKAKRWILS